MTLRRRLDCCWYSGPPSDLLLGVSICKVKERPHVYAVQQASLFSLDVRCLFLARR